MFKDKKEKDMWPFRKKVETLAHSGLTQGMTDWHSHILPGIDDGIPELELSLEVLREYDRMGIRDVWFTPHIMEDFPNETKELQKIFEEVQLAWDGEVKLHLASENMLDSLFEERLQKRDFLPIGKEGNHLLVETSYFNPPMNFDDLIDGVFSAGYFPVLAHPERYRYMHETDYKDLKERGVLFQSNLLSLVGAYGETARKKVEWMLKEGMVNLIGTDVHRLSMLKRYMSMSPKRKEHLEIVRNLAANPQLD